MYAHAVGLEIGPLACLAQRKSRPSARHVVPANGLCSNVYSPFAPLRGCGALKCQASACSLVGRGGVVSSRGL